MIKSGCVLDNKLEFKLAKLSDSKNANKENLDPSLLFGPTKKPPVERVSSVFDSACVSETSYERLRDNIAAERSKRSLENPTQAMVDILDKMKFKKASTPTPKPKGRKRTKSFVMEDKTDNTPAMLEVIRLKKIRMAEDSSEESEMETSALMKRPKLNFPVSISTDIISPKKTKKKRKAEIQKPPRKTELQKLTGIFEEPKEQRRRTRSDQILAYRQIRSNLRSAFNFGLGVFRSVSQSLPKFLKYE